MRIPAIILSGAIFAVSAAAYAEDITPEQRDFFEKKIKPILTDKCYKCHSIDSGKNKGGLLLDSHEAMTNSAIITGRGRERREVNRFINLARAYVDGACCSEALIRPALIESTRARQSRSVWSA